MVLVDEEPDGGGGEGAGQRSIRGGRASVRTALYMAALSGIRHNPMLTRFARRLRGLGKPAKVVITACMRKLLTILNAIVRDQLPWKNPVTANQKA